VCFPDFNGLEGAILILPLDGDVLTRFSPAPSFQVWQKEGQLREKVSEAATLRYTTAYNSVNCMRFT